jgi:hypothetical protein
MSLRDVPARTWLWVQGGISLTAITNGILDGTGVLHPPAPLEFGLVATISGAQVGATVMRSRRRALDRAEVAAIKAAAEAKAEAERRWQEQVHTMSAPDPVAGQCPVCGMHDLVDLVQRDKFLQLTDTPHARVTAYGPVFAHQECAEVMPYVSFYCGTLEDLHHRGHHHAGYADKCAACLREKVSGQKDPYPPPDKCPCITCAQQDAGPAWMENPAQFLTDRILAAMPIPSKARKTTKAPHASTDGVYYVPGQRNPYRWSCKKCPAYAESSSRSHAEALLADHAKQCPARHDHTGYITYRPGCSHCERRSAAAQAVARAEGERLAPSGLTAAGADDLRRRLRDPDPVIRETAWQTLYRNGLL